MPSFRIFDIAGSGLSAESVRLNTVASNLANADTVSGDPNTVYRAKHPVFEAVKSNAKGGQASAAVKVDGIFESNATPLTRYEPGNPLADQNGNVYAPNINTVGEMVDMISASRAYQNDVSVMTTSKDMMLATLKLGQ
jgi:flagellar basal-body rod protein FlgC